ncbi:glycosyltransferase family 39 protein [Thiotrichales bacterium HSG1]|nr:glycosyltransferase family 39 protein [Thiotrichales bacterium HSG1]
MISQRRSFILLIAILMLIGGIVRLIPLSSQERMLNSVSEDGYLMMTIARNMALGHGMSTANGTIPTNGTQPLTTGLWAISYWLVDGDKIQGIIIIILIQFIIATLAALLIWQGGKRILHKSPNAGTVSALAATTWYASPILVGHTVNGLETGLYVFCIIGVAILFSFSKQSWNMWRWFGLGILLGITFWVRNDAALFIFAACVTHLLLGSFEFAAFKRRFLQVILMGATSVIVVLPWLINNIVNFGNLMPISGQAESFNMVFAYSLPYIPRFLIEYLFVFMPIPHILLIQTWVQIAIAIFLLIVLIWMLVRKLHLEERRMTVLISIFAVCLVIFYGLFFGAHYFAGRYMFPTSPFLALLWASVVVFIWQRLPAKKVVMPMIGLLFITIMIGLHVRTYLFTKHYVSYFQYLGGYSMYMYLPEWVDDNIPEDVWVGSWQSGAIGYFHDRTLNLDGKTSPHSLEARQQNRLPEYIINGDIQYLVDWVQMYGIITKTIENPSIQQHFEFVVYDKQKNLLVMRRKTYIENPS